MRSRLEVRLETSTTTTTTREQAANNILLHRIMDRMICPILMRCLLKGRVLHSTNICDPDQPINLLCLSPVCLSQAPPVFQRCRERNPNRTYENPRRRYSRWLQICRLFLLVVSRRTTGKWQTKVYRATLHRLGQVFREVQHLLLSRHMSV